MIRRKQIIQVCLRSISATAPISSPAKVRMCPAPKSPFISEKAFVGGEWLLPLSKYPVLDPYDETITGFAADCDEIIAIAAVSSASAALVPWRNSSVRERATVLRKWCDLLNSEKQSLAELITLENGKPISQAVCEVQCAADAVYYYAEESTKMMESSVSTKTDRWIMVKKRQPVGVVSILTPRDSPIAIPAIKLAAALSAGCTTVLKPSDKTPFSSLALARLAQKAGISRGVINVVPCSKPNMPSVGKLLCTHPSIAGLSFTGSTAIGKEISKQAGLAGKRVCLHNRINNSFLVLNSCDLDKAAETVFASIFLSSRQTYAGANHIFVQSSVHDEFVSKLTSAVKKEIVAGDVFDRRTNFGRLLNRRLGMKLEKCVDQAVHFGGVILTGGNSSSALDISEPIIIKNCDISMKRVISDTSGRIVPIFKFDTEDDCVEMINHINTGEFRSRVYSTDTNQYWRVAEKLRCSLVELNGSRDKSFDHGLWCAAQEDSQQSADEFVNIKHMYVGFG